VCVRARVCVCMACAHSVVHTLVHIARLGQLVFEDKTYTSLLAIVDSSPTLRELVRPATLDVAAVIARPNAITSSVSSASGLKGVVGKAAAVRVSVCVRNACVTYKHTHPPAIPVRLRTQSARAHGKSADAEVEHNQTRAAVSGVCA
jgi:hypothetical protein